MSKSQNNRRFKTGCLITTFALVCISCLFFFVFIPQAREAARYMQCKGHCKQLALALYNYNDHYKCLPPAYTVDENGNRLHSWRVLVLPFIEQQELYDEIRLDEPWNSEHNQQFHARMPRHLSCPSSPHYEKTNYLTNYLRIVGPETLTNGPDTVSLDDVHDKACTILFVESTRQVCWMAPEDITFEDFNLDDTDTRIPSHESVGITSFHPRGINIAMCDGAIVNAMNNTPVQFFTAAAKVRLNSEK